MNRHNLLLLAPILALTACQTPGTEEGSDEVGEGTASTNLASLSNSGLRFDGIYQYQPGKGQNYLMRFFPEGNVVLVNGPDTTAGASLLRTRLTKDAPESQKEGLYNVPVIQRNDSLVWVTRGAKGDIDYAGVILGPDSVRFYKYSHVNGARGVFTYRFDPDAGS